MKEDPSAHLTTETARPSRNSGKAYRILANEGGFDLIEVLFAVAVLIVAFGAVSSLMYFYGARLAELRADQDLRASSGTILMGFASTESCNRQISGLLGLFPVKPPVLDRDFSTVEFGGRQIPTSGPFPDQPLGRLRGVRLRLEGVPLPGQKVLRGRIHIEYDRISSHGMPTRPRSRSRSVFLALDPDGRVTTCLDDKAYKEVEWSEKFCKRLNGQYVAGFSCDLRYSEFARRAACKSMGLMLTGDMCDPP